uniref:Uncharacterized protein n=1 Tax=Salix viminalis TaxID=40686 RepID=A0A6N2KD49_SALVM
MATIGSGLKSTSINGVKMYMVSSQQRSPASWVGSRKKRPSLKDKIKDERHGRSILEPRITCR